MESIVAGSSLSPTLVERKRPSLVRSLDHERAALAEAMLACYLSPDASIVQPEADLQSMSPWTNLQECLSTYTARAQEEGSSSGRIVFDLIALARTLPRKDRSTRPQ